MPGRIHRSSVLQSETFPAKVVALVVPLLAAKNLHRDGARPRPIQLGEDDTLPDAPHYPAAAHRQHSAGSQQERAEMGCSIAAIAVGIAWIVVPPGNFRGDGLFH